VILMCLILLVVAWSYLLGSHFTSGNIRYLNYFAPIMAILLVFPGPRNHLLILAYFFFVVFGLFYFLNYNISVTTYREHFGGLFVDPQNGPLITFGDILVAAIISGALLGLENVSKIPVWIRENMKKLLVLSLCLLVFFQSSIL